MRRRTLLQLITTLVAWPASGRLHGQASIFSATDLVRLRAVADVVLPTEVAAADRGRITDGFVTWVQNYRPGAETDHGYGFPRLRRTPALPFDGYRRQLAALGAGFEELPAEERSRVVAAAIDAAKVQRLPARPDGTHVASDLMAYYFNSPEANDLAYRARIGADSCRGLAGSEQRPPSLGGL